MQKIRAQFLAQNINVYYSTFFKLIVQYYIIQVQLNFDGRMKCMFCSLCYKSLNKIAHILVFTLFCAKSEILIICTEKHDLCSARNIREQFNYYIACQFIVHVDCEH